MRLHLAILMLVVLLAGTAVAQYVMATRFMYTAPRVPYYPTSTCVMVDADPTTPFCYQDAVRLCLRANSGYCFKNCAQHVANLCSQPRMIPEYSLPINFEKQYPDRRSCQIGVREQCQQAATLGEKYECERRGFIRCSSIGRTFV